MQNTLQTRRGNYGSEQIAEWASLDTYWDFHAQRQGQFGYVGDIGIKFSLTPFNGLSFTSEMLWDAGQNNKHNAQATRNNGRKAGRVGLMKLKYLNVWNTSLTYKISEDWKIYGTYSYSDSYRLRGTYSMGSMLEQINATSATLSADYKTAQSFTIGIDFPTYIDPKLKAGARMSYDIEKAVMSNVAFYLKRNFHCIDAAVEFGRNQELDTDKGKDTDYYVMFLISLSTMPEVGSGYKQKF